jgi:hypothetical protein
MTRDDFMNNYWNYYLLLEEKFLNSLRYVELSEDNYDTFSMEFVNQIQSLGSEIDVVFKGIAGFEVTDRKNIGDYANMILSCYPNIVGQRVKIVGKNIVIEPFQGWNTSTPADSLVWWKQYNNIKHGRVGNFTEANLKCCLHLLAGIYILESYWLKKIADETSDVDIPDKESEIFMLQNWTQRYISNKGMVLEVVD